MHYYIDGYNLLFHTVDASKAPLQRCRHSLIDHLNFKVSGLQLNMSVVFDSHYRPGEGSKGHVKDLEILFSPQGVTADDFILQQIQLSRNPHLETVVTSDRDLAHKAHLLGAQTLSIPEFISWLNRRHENKRRKLTSMPSVKSRVKKSVDSNLEARSISREPLKSWAEGSQEYYLGLFEEALKVLPPPESSPKRLRPAAKSRGGEPLRRRGEKRVAAAEGEGSQTEDERWLKLFEDKLRNLDSPDQ